MKSGVKAILIYQGKILLSLRDNKSDIPYPNMWDLPGGGCEEGESMEDSLRRELREELNISPKRLLDLGIETRIQESRGGRFLVYLEDQDVERLKLGDEGQKFEFFTLDQALNLNMVPFLQDFLKRNDKWLEATLEKGQEVNLDQVSLRHL